VGADKLTLKGRTPALLAQLGLPGSSITLALRDAGGEFYRATVPADFFVANGSGTKLRFRDRTGTIAGGITKLTIGGSLRTDVAITGRHLSLAGASAGPFTATITIGDLTLEASGMLRTTGAKLVYP